MEEQKEGSSQPPSGEVPSVFKIVCSKLTPKFWWLLGLDEIQEDIDQHAANIKKARAVVFLIVIIALFGSLGYMVKGWVVQSELDDAVAEARSLKKENERQDKAINEKNLQIVRAEQERDTLKLQMAPFQAIAASIYTNEPPHKRLDSLFALLQGVTNDLQALGPAAMDFRLIANDSFVTNGLVKVPTNGQLVLAARNIGKFTAENLNISISFLEATNHVLAEGWTMPGSLSGDNPGDARYPLWRVRAKDSIPTSGVFYAPPMYIQGKLDPPLDAVVLIYSHRAAVKRFVLKLSMVESNK